MQEGMEGAEAMQVWKHCPKRNAIRQAALCRVQAEKQGIATQDVRLLSA